MSVDHRSAIPNDLRGFALSVVTVSALILALPSIAFLATSGRPWVALGTALVLAAIALTPLPSVRHRAAVRAIGGSAVAMVSAFAF